MKLTVKKHGNLKRTKNFLNKAPNIYKKALEKYINMGIDALKNATPSNTGETANSWDGDIKVNRNSIDIYWFNTNINDGVSIAILLQYGHATKNGGYVQGIDYINPAMKKVFDDITNEAWNTIINL